MFVCSISYEDCFPLLQVFQPKKSCPAGWPWRFDITSCWPLFSSFLVAQFCLGSDGMIDGQTGGTLTIEVNQICSQSTMVTVYVFSGSDVTSSSPFLSKFNPVDNVCTAHSLPGERHGQITTRLTTTCCKELSRHLLSLVWILIFWFSGSRLWPEKEVCPMRSDNKLFVSRLKCRWFD